MEGHSEADSSVSSSNQKQCSHCECIPKWAVDLVMWRDVKKTAPVFVGGFVLLFMLMNLSLISVVAYCGLLMLTSAAVVKAISKFAPKLIEGCPCFTWINEDESNKCEITRERAERFVDAALPHVNAMFACGHVVFSLVNFMETAKFALLFWILTYLGCWFNLITLVTIFFALAFTVPRIYEQFQPQFDNLGTLAKAQLEQVCKLFHEKVDLIKQKIRERTGKEKAQ